jgi:molecular chaperone GrpE
VSELHDTDTTDTQPSETAPEAESVAPDGDTGGGGLGDEQEEETAAEQVISDLDRLQMERNDYLDQLLRTRADFDNYRKRLLKQQTEAIERAGGDLVGRLLGVLDVLDGANAHGEGFEQVGIHLVATLEKEGLERVDPAGRPFDPNEADAVAHEEGADGEGGGEPVVSAVLRPGYRWKGRLLRPAMVKVRG